MLLSSYFSFTVEPVGDTFQATIFPMKRFTLFAAGMVAGAAVLWLVGSGRSVRFSVADHGGILLKANLSNGDTWRYDYRAEAWVPVKEGTGAEKITTKTAGGYGSKEEVVKQGSSFSVNDTPVNPFGRDDTPLDK